MRSYSGRKLCGIKGLEHFGLDGEIGIQSFFMPLLAKDAGRIGLWGCKIWKECGRKIRGELKA